MESHGLPGQIQVTARMATELAAAGFAIKPRGTIDIKSKGPTETFVLD
jgi:guanylate cyclase